MPFCRFVWNVCFFFSVWELKLIDLLKNIFFIFYFSLILFFFKEIFYLFVPSFFKLECSRNEWVWIIKDKVQSFNVKWSCVSWILFQMCILIQMKIKCILLQIINNFCMTYFYDALNDIVNGKCYNVNVRFMSFELRLYGVSHRYNGIRLKFEDEKWEFRIHHIPFNIIFLPQRWILIVFSIACRCVNGTICR